MAGIDISITCGKCGRGLEDGDDVLCDPCWNSLERKYDELMHAVQRKFEGESRHETALRYIREAEQPTGEASAEGR